MPSVDPGSVHTPRPLSREYLEAYHSAAARTLPRWLGEQLHSIARPTSGGAANRRIPQHTPIEKALLSKLDPIHISDLSDDDLRGAWRALVSWYTLATRKKMDVEVYERAASFCAQEMQRRGIEIWKQSDLGARAMAKSRLVDRLTLLPGEIYLGPVASLAPDDEAGVRIAYSRALGDDGEITSALAQAGIRVAKSEPGDDCEIEDAIALYDMVLRRPGFDGLPTEISTGPVLGLEASVETLSKASPEKRLVGYVAADPETPDSYGHRISVEEVEDECHRFALGPREVYMEHGELQGLNATGRWPRRLTGQAVVVESFIVRQPIAEIFGHKLERPIPLGAWFVVIYYPDPELWEFLKANPHGISWRGLATMEKK